MPFFTTYYEPFKEKSIHGRYLTHDHISPLLKKLDANFKLTEIGKSVKNTSIKSIEFGNGTIKILMWSQMHGNESTTTKAIFDLLNFLKSGNDAALQILEKCTLKIIPMLNPDGAAAYTRVNAHGIDLNRDAQDLSQPESRILREVYDGFLPDFCFNLHDQRTMYNVGQTDKPATVSFLAPAFDQKRSLSGFRQEAMFLIHKMNRLLQEFIPGQVGRYDDAYNANCVGDTFQMLETPTVLFEAGHFSKDYERERTRELIFVALVEAISAAMEIDRALTFKPATYFEIPENEKQFFDVLIKNTHLLDAAYEKGLCLGIRYEEQLRDGTIYFEPKLESVFNDGYYLGHKTYDCAHESELQELRVESFFSKLFNLSSH